MNKSEFRELIYPLTHFEEKLRDSNNRTALMERHILEEYQSDDSGYLVLTNQGMKHQSETETDVTLSSILRNSLSHPLMQGNLRLIIHSRFSTIPFHSDEFISINYVYSGTLKLRLPKNEQIYQLTKGQYFIMNAEIVHSFEIAGANDIIMGFQIEPSILSNELLYGLQGQNPVVDFLINTLLGHRSDFSYYIASYQRDEQMSTLFEDLFCEYLEPSVCSEELVTCYLKMFFILVLRSSSQHLHQSSKVDILEILNYMQKHCNKCSLDILAEKFHFNAKYLSRLLHEKTGQNFSTLLMEMRFKNICYQLTGTKLSIQEIAENNGFTNQNFFYKKFQEKYGMTPKQYRLQSQVV
ncbi:AraC family transcriptional regulator [Blautia producta]|uniref:Urease operon transcriptional activator n=1 Tax=Blautia producta TaxID=33035 RepID=A0A4P6M1C4_9FIRM|nr:AraC family transcriptional regulator [Blautia producta]QBE97400.1 Urease operon transcriptional activator [Blautia producta]